jgi:hypothetical protein
MATAHNQEIGSSYGLAERVERASAGGGQENGAAMHPEGNGRALQAQAALAVATTAAGNGSALPLAYSGNGRGGEGLDSIGSNGNGASLASAASNGSAVVSEASSANGKASANSKASSVIGKANGSKRAALNKQKKSQDKPEGAVWGQGARGRGNPPRGVVDANYETAIRVAGPLRCALLMMACMRVAVLQIQNPAQVSHVQLMLLVLLLSTHKCILLRDCCCQCLVHAWPWEPATCQLLC